MDAKQYRDGLRTFLKDFQEFNRLLKFEEESSDDKLDLYLNMALGFLNGIPPNVATWGMADFPMPSLLIHQSAIEALISNTILQSRNELTYNNGGISVKVPDGSRYNGALQHLYNVTRMELDYLLKLKVSINIDGGWGGINSPYQFIAGYPYLIRPYNGLQG